MKELVHFKEQNYRVSAVDQNLTPGQTRNQSAKGGLRREDREAQELKILMF